MKDGLYMTNLDPLEWTVDGFKKLQAYCEEHAMKADENGNYIIPLPEHTTQDTIELLRARGFKIIRWVGSKKDLKPL